MKKFKHTLKRKKIWIPSLILATLLIVFVVWGSFHYSKKQVIRDYVSAYQKSGDTFDNIKGYIVWADNDEKVTTDEAKYATFSKLSKTEADKLSSELKKADASDDAYVKKIGHKFLIFPNYRIALSL